MPVQCVYDVLGLPMDCRGDDIKKAYKKAAIRWHPDKNRDKQEEAEAQFKEVTRAYTVLSDPQERAWYDTHRDSIHRGGDGTAGGDGSDDEDEGIDLFRYFSETCYSGFTFDEAGNDFFTVFGSVFDQLVKEESEEEKDRIDYPPFGAEHTKWDEVGIFYSYCCNFSSQRSFSWKDKLVSPRRTQSARQAADGEGEQERTGTGKEGEEQPSAAAGGVGEEARPAGQGACRCKGQGEI